MTCRIYVEGESDGELIRLVLEDLANQYSFKIIVTNGADDARPSARSASQRWSDPVMLVTNAETANPSLARAREQDLDFYFAWRINDRPFKLIQFVPQCEVVFFEVTGLLEEVLGGPVDPALKQVGPDAPKKVMSVLGTSVQQIAQTADHSHIAQRLREHPKLAELRDFVQTYAHRYAA
ncbi:MAG: hypothetical protein JO171_17115 [Paludibacterium sp.]|uniref:hypothetical protein n=1 Tax=Paludibacterium sp. TaxID=1917523 RepID=UPI0025E429C5|nr:hypothetical protein [Paludibacterium sp.]MBV8048872.1 hypothetical protein [Paludibacterium sp.]